MIKQILHKIHLSAARIFGNAYYVLYIRLSDGIKKSSALKNLMGKHKKELHNLKSLLYEKMPPELYPYALKQWYKSVTGNTLHLSDPKTYSEKIQWLKLYDQDPLKTRLSDKYLVRDWVKEKIGEQYLIRLYGVYRNADEIDFNSLPEEYVIKSNHASGMKIIVRDGYKPDPELVRKIADCWLMTNYAFQNGFELYYRDIPRRLLIEEYLKTKTGKTTEFKLFCFNGRCRFIETITKTHNDIQVTFYDLDWNIMPFNMRDYQPVPMDYPKPEALPEMIRVAETLASGFIHVRVDLYLLDQNIIKFGEMTFSPVSGRPSWDPPEADLMVGEMLDIQM